MDNIYMISDTELIKRISSRLKAIRLKQNVSRHDLSVSSGVSTSTIARIEDGEIKSFESLLRILRTLGKIDIFLPLVEEEEISPNEYYQMVHSAKANKRKRASRTNNNNVQEESEYDVKCDGGTCMAEMCVTIYCRSADIHAHVWCMQWAEHLFFYGQGVINIKCLFHFFF